MGAFKISDILGIKKPINTCKFVHIPRAVHKLRKDRKSPKLSPLAELDALCKQDMKAEL